LPPARQLSQTVPSAVPIPRWYQQRTSGEIGRTALDGNARRIKFDIRNTGHRQGIGNFAMRPGKALIFLDTPNRSFWFKAFTPGVPLRQGAWADLQQPGEILHGWTRHFRYGRCVPAPKS
jgi:hypothetical protein